MKSIYLFSLLTLLICSCNQQEESKITYDFDESIFGEYEIYYLDLNVSSFTCPSPSSLQINNIDSSNVISFGGTIYDFEEQDGDVYTFRNVRGSIGYETTSVLTYYSCADSLHMYETSQNYPPKSGFAKKINGKNCTTNSTSVFEHLVCTEGPSNSMCYSSSTVHSFITDKPIPAIAYLSIDVGNNTLVIGVEDFFRFMLPTDSSATLLEGKYWIGEVPAGDQQLLEVSFSDNANWGVSTTSFEMGYLDVKVEANEYVISFDLTCTGDSRWTGYYKGEVN